MPAGFVALWNNNPREYAATAADEWGTTDRIQAAFAAGRARGNRTYGLYFCRWSSAWQYMTFWVSPGLDAVFDTIADLERAGDFKFADSEHLVGVFVDEEGYLTPGAWDVIPEPDGDGPSIGVVLTERRSAPTAGDHRGLEASARKELHAIADRLGVRMYGAFDCRFGSGWDRFSFWTAPDLDGVERALGWIESRLGPERPLLRVVTGRLDRHFRFGSHLQTELRWLNEEASTR